MKGVVKAWLTGGRFVLYFVSFTFLRKMRGKRAMYLKTSMDKNAIKYMRSDTLIKLGYGPLMKTGLEFQCDVER